MTHFSRLRPEKILQSAASFYHAFRQHGYNFQGGPENPDVVSAGTESPRRANEVILIQVGAFRTQACRVARALGLVFEALKTY